jgi:hypothetical protein
MSATEEIIRRLEQQGTPIINDKPTMGFGK